MPKQSKGQSKTMYPKNYSVSNQDAKSNRLDSGKGDMIYNSPLFKKAVRKESAKLGFNR